MGETDDLGVSYRHTIEVLRRDAAKAKNGTDRLEAALNALALWRIQSLEQIGWALDVVEQNAPDQPSRQVELWFYLQCARPSWHGLADEADWRLTWVPTDLHEELIEALAAFPFGEVRQILEPVKAGKHGAAYSAGAARLVAVEHVEFLAGQGYTKRKAREIVATAMGEEEDPIRSWKDTLLPKAIGREKLRKVLGAAHEAGRLSEAFEACDVEMTVHMDVLAAYERHKEIDLQVLGRRLRKPLKERV